MTARPIVTADSEERVAFDTVTAAINSAPRRALVQALLAVLADHEPSPSMARMVDSTKCPDHNPKDHPELFAATDLEFAESCPACVVGYYVTCSSWDCHNDYPCNTVKMVAEAIGVDLDQAAEGRAS